jgi:hypothetical protein
MFILDERGVCIPGSAHSMLVNELKIIHKKLNEYIKFLRKSYLDANRKPINE